jgi:spermidine/putrescine ABC transporter ATP-binding subunit
MAQVTLENVSRRYGNVAALEEMSFLLQSGQFLTLLGPSGCGKSTTLRIIAGLLQPSSGRVLLDGRDVTALSAARRNIGMVFQSLALFPHMTAAENVAFGLKMRKVGTAEKAARVKRMLDIVQLGPLADRYPAQMSGGQQQRIALARALVIEPSILILDEPFGALDRKLREAMQVELRQITRDLAITALFVTHDQEEALMLSDVIAVMNRGRVEQLGTPAAIFRRPATRFVADFMGVTNFLDGRLVATEAGISRIEAAGIAFGVPADPNLHVGREVSVAIRPEGVTLSRAAPGDSGVAGRVLQATYHGNVSSYAIKLDSGPMLIARESNDEMEPDDAIRFPVGSMVWASWRQDAVHLFDR